MRVTRGNKAAAAPQKRMSKTAAAQKIAPAVPAAAPASKLSASPARRAAAATPWTVSNRPQLAIAAGAAVLIVATLVLARDPSRSPSVTLNAASAAPEPSTEFATVDTQPGRRSAASAKASPSREARLATAAPGAPGNIVPIAPTPIAPAPATDEAPREEAPLRNYAPSTQATTSLPSVTITGCLEVSTDGDQFRLTDTDGTDAPKARGWRSGFLKKRPAPVDLVASDAPALRRLVGRRVSATGPLDSRELHVRSFRSAGSCS